MKVLFAVSNESVSESIVKKYQQMYKEIILSKNVYYFNAIIKELQKDKTYDRVVISEDLEPFTNSNYEAIDNFIFEKLDNISDEATTNSGEDIPIILIATDRRSKSDNLLIKLFGIGIYSALLGQDRRTEELCKLIQKPRSKKEAKAYYKIDSNDVDYKPENEGSVSEGEIQNILAYFKRLGRNEDRYVESFDSLAAQYTDQQLRVIIKFLPLNVKAVLEANSPRYQQIVSFGNQNIGGKGASQTINKTKMKNNTTKAISNNGIKVKSIPSGEKKLTRPVIIPSMNKVRKVQRVEEETPIVTNTPVYQEVEPIEEIIEEEPKRRRGRPKKIQPQQEEILQEEPKRKRGRPKKIMQEENEEDIMLPQVEEDDGDDNFLGFEDFDEENILPSLEEEPEQSVLPGFGPEDEEEKEDILPGFEEDEDEEELEENNENILPGFGEEEEKEELEENSEDILPGFGEDFSDIYDEEKPKTDLESYQKKPESIERLLTNNQKIVAFVGTSKNGTSFLVNNLAEVLSNQGIKTAILDLTKNKNSYYIYTKNEEELRKTAFSCMELLTQGVAQGVKVNNNLDVYTSLPGEDEFEGEVESVLETLVQNYSLVLLDCDFKTNYAYLKEAQEIYLVQSMDVLTIQPLTAYLKDLKAKGILEQSKLKVVINKYIRVRGISEKAIIGGMAFYNDPAMAFMSELFNRETIPYAVIPFDVQTYTKYLEALINCNISINGYSKDLINSLKKLANMVYPLISGNMNNKIKNNKYTPASFSNNVSSTLDKMREKY